MEKTALSRRGFVAGAACAAVGAVAATAPAMPALAEQAPGTVTVTASAQGFGGEVTVTLTVDTANGVVVDAAIEGADETPDRGGRAIANAQASMVETGTIDVSATAGATVTSDAIADAATAAYNEAMGISSSTVVKMKPGKYTGAAKGYWQIWELPVTITVNETSILKIEVPDDRFAHGETEVMLANVKDLMFPRIIESQSIAVDAIAGATSTSNAVKMAIKQALQDALVAGGSDASAVSAFQIPPAKPEVGDPEEIDVDVLVVGMGNGGIMAMKSACETIQSINPNKLVSVLGIDRAGKYGGKSALTHEGCAVNPPKYMEEINGGEPFVDADLFREVWRSYTSQGGEQRAKDDLVDLFFAESGNTIDWLHGQGWIFGDMGKPNPFTGGLTSYNVVLTSNTDTGSYEDRRAGVDKYYKSMLAAVKAQGGDWMLETEGYELLLDEANPDRVVGVKARNVATGQEYLIHAKAVIMNTGGFGSNPEMINALLDPRWAGERRGIGTGQDTGLMVQAALDAGAGTWNIEMSPNVMHVTLDHWLDRYPINFYEDRLDGRTGRYKVWTLNNIPMATGISANTVAVKADGTRFMNEARYESFASDVESESWPCYQAGSYYYTITSADVLDEVAASGFSKIPKFEGYCSQGDIPGDMPVPEVYEGLGYAVEEGMAWKADTLADLASQIGIDPSVLEQTVADYNALVDAGEDSAFGKDPEFLTRIETAPFYAVRVYNASFSTAGGLDVDTQIRVLKDDHATPIEGLYATGVDSMGVLLHPERNYSGFGGVAQGWLWTSGRLAGINAANFVNETYGGFTYVSPALVDTSAVSTAR